MRQPAHTRQLDLESWQAILQRPLAILKEWARQPAARAGEAAEAHAARLLTSLPLHRGLSRDRAEVLFLAGLLLPVARAPERLAGDDLGIGRARDVLFALGIPGPVRDDVLGLVRSAGLPQHLGRRAPSLGRLLRLAWTVDTELLLLLALAACDANGAAQREACCSAARAFGEACRQSGLLGRQPPPLVPRSRWNRIAPADPAARRVAAGELRFWRLKGLVNTRSEAEAWLRRRSSAPVATFYLPVGVPGAGKSTWVRHNLERAITVSMDDLREQLLGDRADQRRNPEVYRRCRALLGRALRAGEAVVWDAQSHTWAARQSLLAAAREAHAYVVVVYFDVPLDVALRRNARRPKPVPESVIRRSYRQLEEPRPFEAEELWRVDVDSRISRQVADDTAGA
ncbi:MAG: AAA family ATPase [Anaerolineae bacterium]